MLFGMSIAAGTIFFGIISGCLLSVLVGFVGSGRKIGFGWAFLISILTTPIVGLIVTLLSSPLPNSTSPRWGCFGTIIGLVGFLSLAAFIMLFATLLGAGV